MDFYYSMYVAIYANNTFICVHRKMVVQLTCAEGQSKPEVTFSGELTRNVYVRTNVHT